MHFSRPQFRLAGQVTHKTSNFSKSSEIEKWHSVACFSKKDDSYRNLVWDSQLGVLAIIEVFQTWRRFLESCKYKALVPTNHNNPRWVMQKKSLNSRQVQEAWKTL